MTDFYEVLGVDRSATQNEIKKAYRALTIKFHPDKNQGDSTAEEKFKKINEAYATLGDEEKRAFYDNPPRRDFDMFGDDLHGFGSINIDDLISNFFSRQDAQPTYQKDLNISLNVKLSEAFTGCKRELNVEFFDRCHECNGVGADAKDVIECPKCKGTGKIKQNSANVFIKFMCPMCRGSGKFVKSKSCKACSGEGKKRINHKISVTIPKGILPGARLRIPEKGFWNPTLKKRGDVFVTIGIESVEGIFHVVENGDLSVELEIDFETALIDGSVTLKTLDERTLDIPLDAFFTGSTIKIEGEGMPNARGPGKNGNLFVDISVTKPSIRNESVDAAARALRDELIRAKKNKVS